MRTWLPSRLKNRESVASPMRMIEISKCDICGSDRLRPIAGATPNRCAIKMCNNCGHFFASPALDPSDLESFYNNDFDGDGGAPTRIGEGVIPEYRIQTENRKMKRWALPIIEQHLDVRGLRVLDLRSRTGALAELLTQKGADVVGIDPFQANIDYATEFRTVGSMRHCPVSSFPRLDMLEESSFDAVTALTIHTLAHLPSPRAFLERIYEVIRHGGFLFFDEKTIMEPENAMTTSVFDSGVGHFHHFTVETMEKLFRVTGFEIMKCTAGGERKSFAKHILLVARKPAAEVARQAVDPIELKCDTETRLLHLAAAESKLRRKRLKNIIKRKFKAVSRKFS